MAQPLRAEDPHGGRTVKCKLRGTHFFLYLWAPGMSGATYIRTKHVKWLGLFKPTYRPLWKSVI